MNRPGYIFLLLFIIAPLCLSAQAPTLQKVLDLTGQWKFRIGDKMDWISPHLEDQNWENIKVPSEWEAQGYHGYDGYAWYRKTFEGTKTARFNNIYLNMGYIDDVDQVYINGHLVGFSGGFPPNFSTAYNGRRLYRIPKEILNPAGTNVIAVRVFDTIQGGGIVSGDLGLFASWSAWDDGLLLEGVWKFEEGFHPTWKNPDYDDSDWGVIMVPGFWRSLGKKSWQSVAWYRKEFKIPGRLEGKELVLLMGKIDDFDKVYLNGKLIGTTNDGKPLGSSYSYEQLRIYSIPLENINQTGKNLLAVEVMDIGGNAGIYEGPVGVFPAEVVRQYIRPY